MCIYYHELCKGFPHDDSAQRVCNNLHKGFPHDAKSRVLLTQWEFPMTAYTMGIPHGTEHDCDIMH